MSRLSNGELRRRAAREARRHTGGFSVARPEDALERGRETGDREHGRKVVGRVKLFIQVKSYRRTEED